MANPYFNNQVRKQNPSGGRPSPGTPKGAKGSVNEKPAFTGAGAPGKKGPDRSGGSPKAKVYPSSDGI